MATSSSSASTKIILLTGVTGQIGGAIGRLIATQGHTLILPVRDIQRGKNVQQALIAETGNSNIYLEQVDLASYKSIRKFVQTFESKYPKLDVLINNAAYTPSAKKTLTVDNLESNFAINIFSYYLLMQGLRSSLKKASPQARIVNVASNYAGHLDVTDIQFDKRQYNSTVAYQQSKQADRMLSYAAAQEYKQDGISVYACHPGVVTSNLLQSLGMSKGYESAEQGAQTPVFLATNMNIVKPELTGTYWNSCKQTNCQFSKQTNDIKELWKLCQNIEQKLETISKDNEL